MRLLVTNIVISAVVFGAVSSVSADARLDEPLAVRNEQPLAHIANIPTARSGLNISAGNTEWRMDIDVANNFVRDDNGRETLVLDGESQRYQFGIRHGLNDRWEVGVTVPWISYNGGIADNFIEGWHNFWNLPDGDRPDHPTGKLQFLYQRDGATELDFHRATSGIGDVQFNAAYQWLHADRTDIAVAITLTAPTGSADKLTGNDSGNVGVALAATQRQLFGLPLTATANIGALWLPEGDVLAAQQKNTVWFASGEIGWAATQDLRFKIQLDANSALYDSTLTALGSDALQLLLGGSLRLTQKWILDAAIGEDIRVDTAPDVIFHLALRSTY